MDRGAGSGVGGYSPWVRRDSDTTEATEHAHTLFEVTESYLLIMQFQKSVSIMILFAFCINY